MIVGVAELVDDAGCRWLHHYWVGRDDASDTAHAGSWFQARYSVRAGDTPDTVHAQMLAVLAKRRR